MKLIVNYISNDHVCEKLEKELIRKSVKGLCVHDTKMNSFPNDATSK